MIGPHLFWTCVINGKTWLMVRDWKVCVMATSKAEVDAVLARHQ